MNRTSRTIGRVGWPALWLAMLAVAVQAAGVADYRRQPSAASSSGEPFRMVVMDPLALPLSCECVEGHAQRRYGRLALYLQERLGRPVRLAFTEDLAGVAGVGENPADLVIGKQSVVAHDGVRLGLDLRPVARLTGKDGGTTLRGLFVVRAEDPARSIEDLEGRRILFGPPENREKYAAVAAALRARGLTVPDEPHVGSACSTAAVAVTEGDADAAVISDYARPLLAGCGHIERGALRVVGRTEPVPFVTALAAGSVFQAGEEERVRAALLSVEDRPDLLAALETERGFVPAPPREPAEGRGWPDWRGPRRDAVTDDLPARLPEKPKFLWKKDLTGWGLSGVAVAGNYVIVADKDEDAEHDVWRCLDADTGRELWTLRYPAAGQMSFTNSPRATPVIRGNRAYLLGAFGHIHCVELETGRILWSRLLVEDLGGRRPPWGYAATPLVMGEKLIVNPGAKEGCLKALNRFTGATIWESPGAETAYASLVPTTPGGRRQVVGYDAVSLGGWDPRTGERLWKVLPANEGDFNVPTPVVWQDYVLAATENNGTRLYGFDGQGRIRTEPAARFEDLAPDTTTPVVMDDLVLGCSAGRLYCLDLRNGLELLWEMQDDAFYDHDSLIAGNGRVLILGVGGELVLLRVRREGPRVISRLRSFQSEKTEIWSHPALVGDRLYVRNRRCVGCLDLR